jgi:hypothetical protein
MPTKWTWNRQRTLGSQSGDENGWVLTDGVVISAPQALQRVILRASVNGLGGGTAVPPIAQRPWAAGAIELTLGVGDLGEGQGIWEGRHGLIMNMSQVFDGAAVYTELAPTCAAFDIDQTVRRAAPPPPEEGLALNWSLSYVPLPIGDSTFYNYVTDWNLYLHLQWLVSEPTT